MTILGTQKTYNVMSKEPVNEMSIIFTSPELRGELSGLRVDTRQQLYRSLSTRRGDPAIRHINFASALAESIVNWTDISSTLSGYNIEWQGLTFWDYAYDEFRMAGDMCDNEGDMYTYLTQRWAEALGGLVGSLPQVGGYALHKVTAQYDDSIGFVSMVTLTGGVDAHLRSYIYIIPNERYVSSMSDSTSSIDIADYFQSYQYCGSEGYSSLIANILRDDCYLNTIAQPTMNETIIQEPAWVDYIPPITAGTIPTLGVNAVGEWVTSDNPYPQGITVRTSGLYNETLTLGTGSF